MGYLVDHWSFDPFLIIVVGLVIWHEVGLARLARRSRPERTRQRRRRSWFFYGGLAGALPGRAAPVGLLGRRQLLRHTFHAPPPVFVGTDLGGGPAPRGGRGGGARPASGARR